MGSDPDKSIQVLLAHATAFPAESLLSHLTSAGYHVILSPLSSPSTDPSVDPAVILCGIRSGAGEDIAGLSELSRHHENVDVVAILEDPDLGTGRAALCAGASSWISLSEQEVDCLAQLIDHAARRRQALISARGQIERHRNLIENAPIGVFEITNGRLSYVSDYIVRASGLKYEDLIGCRPERLAVPEDRTRLKRTLKARSNAIGPPTPNIYRFLTSSGQTFIGEVLSQVDELGKSGRIEGTIRDITHETKLSRLHRAVLEIGEKILREEDIDRILHLVLDTITKYSGFRRAVLSLYDLSVPEPLEGPIHKILTSGITPEQEEALRAQEPMSAQERKAIFDNHFRLGPAFYIPHNEQPWASRRGITGTVSIQGWHKDDYLFIPLHGTDGIVGTISVDDPIDQSVPTVAAIEPVASLANLAALAVERVFKLHQLQRQKERLHSLSLVGDALARMDDIDQVCDSATRRVRDDMGHEFCAIWIRDGGELVLHGLATSGSFPHHELPTRGMRVPLNGNGVTCWAIQHREPLVVQDVSTEPRYNPSRETIRSMAAIPIIGHRGVLGAFDIESTSVSTFADQDVEVLSALASQLSTAIASIRRGESLARIYAFGQRVGAATTAEQVIAGTLDFLAEQFDYELSAVVLKRDDGTLSVAGLRGPYDRQNVRVGWVLPEAQGVIGWVARNRRAAVVPDVAADPRYLEAFPGVRSELAVPILFNENVLGVLNLEGMEPGFFNEEDRQILEVIANHLAIALSNLSSQDTLREQAIRDPLTGLYNRHYFNAIIAPELSRGDRYNTPLTLMMIDVDGFRAVNNRYGHLKGDDVLADVAKLLMANVRGADRVIRYGGDEFLVFMPETDEEADRVAERLRDLITAVPHKMGIDDLNLGLSIGIYTRMPNEGHSLEYILEEADRRMYLDKRARHVDRADDYLH